MASNEAANFILDRGRMVYAQLLQARAVNEELLAALELMTDQYEQVCEDNNVMGFPTAVVMAKAAIAKARGRS